MSWRTCLHGYDSTKLSREDERTAKLTVDSAQEVLRPAERNQEHLRPSRRSCTCPRLCIYISELLFPIVYCLLSIGSCLGSSMSHEAPQTCPNSEETLIKAILTPKSPQNSYGQERSWKCTAGGDELVDPKDSRVDPLDYRTQLPLTPLRNPSMLGHRTQPPIPHHGSLPT